MHLIDWIVMLGTLLSIVAYGVWQTRRVKSVQSFLLGDRDLHWWTIGLSIMATQASAITFLSTPGQAYESGMGFAQFYFGLPVAMVFLSIFVLPIYYRLKVYTAYEYLESRFDLKTRSLTALLFLIQRGLAAGLTIYAPAIILSSILDWSLEITIFFIGIIVTYYTFAGGTKAVSVTQKQQMTVILSGMFIAAVIIIFQLPKDVSLNEALVLAGKMEKLNVVDFRFDLSNRYTFWSGMLGGVFLFLSYFGTDQSQVQRYLSGKSLTESRLGLLFNGIFKVPMQFLILFTGILVFIFFQFNPRPVHFNTANVKKLIGTEYEAPYKNLEQEYLTLQEEQIAAAKTIIESKRINDQAAMETARQDALELQAKGEQIREEVKGLIKEQDPNAQTKDTDYVFITFIMNYLPTGLIGLLLAVIFSAAMSSTASEISALATTTVVDIYRRSVAKDKSESHYFRASKFFTLVWGAIALFFAYVADLFDNLIEAVNIIGSLFYGTILGIFIVAFFLKKVGSRAVFFGALMAEAVVLLIYNLNRIGGIYIGSYFLKIEIAYLWLNLIGCVMVVLFSLIIQGIVGPGKNNSPSQSQTLT